MKRNYSIWYSTITDKLRETIKLTDYSFKDIKIKRIILTIELRLHTHTHTHTYIYIYIYIVREKERERKRVR